MQHDILISAYQGLCREGDVTANLATARSVVAEARARGSHFLAFPETFLSGYESPEAVQRGARPVTDPEIQAFVAESAGHEMVILVGRVQRVGEAVYNSILVIQHGQLLGTYAKALLTGGDARDLHFAPGRSVPVFEAHGVRFGIAVCHDSSFPHVAMAARLQGAEVLFTPHYNEIGAAGVEDHMQWVRNCHIGLACQLKMVVVRANIVKTGRPGLVSYGDSFILGPQGLPLAQAKRFREELITARVTPAHFQPPTVWADLGEVPGWLRTTLARLLEDYRPPRDEADLRYWLETMVHGHGYSAGEAASALGLGLADVQDALRRLGVAGEPLPVPPPGASLRVLPYPGGRHPRRGFFDGAVAPQRETKFSVFAPWAAQDYAVVDLPEAIWWQHGLLYLAHEHDAAPPTPWRQQGIRLPPLEWDRLPGGSLAGHRVLPNGVAFGAGVCPGPDGLRLELWLENGAAEPLRDLRVQICVMLGRLPEFADQPPQSRVLQAPFAACRNAAGTRWLITAWEGCQRAWANPACPCIHSDPQFPDCPPGERRHLQGWLSFYEGSDIEAELCRLRERQNGLRLAARPEW